MRRLRVLHVSAYFAPAFVYGGPPRSIHGLCRALVAAGVDVDVMTTTANGQAPELPPAVHVPKDVGGVPVRYFPLAEPRRMWHAPLLRRALQREVRSYDVVHIHGLWHLPGWDAARAARRAGVPYVVSPRGMLEPGALAIHHARKAIAFHLVEHRNLCRAAALHATSPQEAATLESRRLGPPVVLASNGVELPTPADPDPVLEAFAVDPRRPFVLFLGRLHPIKRLDLLADAVARLRHRDAQVVIAGPDEHGLTTSLAARFDAAGIRTIWTGAVDERQKSALLASARALVLCSDVESFGLAVAEAMAAGTAVVVSRTCPWPDVESVGAGRWVPQTPDAIAKALDELLTDENTARNMGARGRALVARKYTWSSIGDRIAECYDQIALVRTPLVHLG